MIKTIPLLIAEELSVREAQVNAAIKLLDEGATVPFIARYRKEVTGALDDTQMRQLEQRLQYLRDMEDRRQTILATIEEQGKLSPQLRQSILEADTKNRLEDLYLPYKQKRRTKAHDCPGKRGLEPLADALLADPGLNPGRRRRNLLQCRCGHRRQQGCPGRRPPDTDGALRRGCGSAGQSQAVSAGSCATGSAID